MKVCFFMNTPFTLGGEQRVTTEIANYLHSQGIKVTFILLDKSGKINREKYNLNEKIDVKFIKEYGYKKLVFQRQLKKVINKINYVTGLFSNNLDVLKSIYLNSKEMNILTSEFKRNRFDCIIGVGLRYSIMLSLMKKELEDTRLIGWQHSTYEAYFETKNSRLYNSKKLARYMFNNLDGYIVQTEYDKMKIEKEFKYKAMVINNPNSTLKKVSSMITTSRNYFISTGRFVKLKNYDKIIYAFSKFLKKNNEWRLLLVGDGPEKKSCEEIATKLGIIDFIDFTGSVTDIEKYYQKSKIYICASNFEGWGMSITEAMLYRNAIISFNFPSVNEIFGNRNCGIILKENNVDEIYYGMVELALEMSKKDLEKIRDSAYKQVENFDIKVVGTKWLNYLSKGEENAE